MTESTPRREATKLKLIEAAIDAFAENGIDATSVEQLSERAGFTRGAFYSNFQSKDDLCIAILEYNRSLALERIRQVLARDDIDLDWALDEGIPVFLASTSPGDDNARLTMLEIRLRAIRVPELRERLRESELQTRPYMEQVLERAVEELGARLRVSVAQLIDVGEAVYLHQTLDGNTDTSLLRAALAALVDHRDEAPKNIG